MPGVCDRITLHLDPKHPILFQDGTHMTAEDIAFSLEYLRDSIPHGGFVGAQVFDVVDVAVSNKVGDRFYTADVFYLSKSFFHKAYLTGVPVIPSHKWRTVPFASPPLVYETTPPDPVQGDVTGQVGTGPFKLIRWDGTVGTVLLERWEGYFKSSGVYDSFHASGNVNGLSPALVDHLRLDHEYLVTYSILTDNSNRIDVLDLVSIGGNFGRSASVAPKADLNEDGTINILDLVRVGGNMFRDWDHGDWTTFPISHAVSYP